jgi:hypothetical protein
MLAFAIDRFFCAANSDARDCERPNGELKRFARSLLRFHTDQFGGLLPPYQHRLLFLLTRRIDVLDHIGVGQIDEAKPLSRRNRRAGSMMVSEANEMSTRCTPSIEIRKTTVPGLFSTN